MTLRPKIETRLERDRVCSGAFYDGGFRIRDGARRFMRIRLGNRRFIQLAPCSWCEGHHDSPSSSKAQPKLTHGLFPIGPSYRSLGEILGPLNIPIAEVPPWTSAAA